MHLPVTIENDLLSLEVWPQFGGKVSSLCDKTDKFELLFNYPSELPQRSMYDLPYASGWFAGWDECFPAVAPSKYVGHPYDGIPVPDHGELWGLPTTAVPTRDGITTVWHGLRFGYRLSRKLYLDGPSAIAEYTLVNLAPFEFRFVWALHGLMSMNVPVEIDLPGASMFRYSHDAEGKSHDQKFDWPHVGDGENLSRLLELPSKRGWKVYSDHPIESPAIVRYPTRSRTLQIEYTSTNEVKAYWGIWISTGGWGGHRHFAIEPTTGRFDEIDRSIKDQSAAQVERSESRTWSVRFTVSKAGVVA